MMRKGEKNDKRYQQSERKSEFFSLESKKKEYSERKGEYFSLDQEKKGYSERRSKESDYLEKRSNLEAT